MNNEALKGHLDLLLLAVVAAAPAHGYAVIQALRERSAEAFDLPEGTVYPALHRLERHGLLASQWTTHEGRRRRVYRVSAEGERALARGRSEWRAFAGGMQAVLGGNR
jgi:PadR family transcriptional regulator